jgi:predicted metal-dependent TIM-barrel fold hydrolase
MVSAIDPLDAEILSSDLTHGYGPRRLPDELDQVLEKVVDALEQSGFVTLLEIFNARHADVFLAFAERIASLAVRRQSSKDIHRGLIAVGIAAELTTDIREVILILPLLWRSASVIGLDPSHEFDSVAEELNGEGSALLKSFTRRTAENQSIQVMGYIESEDDQGFRYRRTW